MEEYYTIEQIRARALHKATRLLDEQFNGDNIFNTTKQLEQMAKTCKDHQQRSETFKKIMNDAKNQQAFYANQEQKDITIKEQREEAARIRRQCDSDVAALERRVLERQRLQSQKQAELDKQQLILLKLQEE